MSPDPAGKLIKYASDLDTPCKKRPWRCTPRSVTHVSWDADDTLWHIEPRGTIASSVRGPFVLVDPDTLEAGCGPAKTTEKPYTPVGQIYNEKTKKWEWLHESKEAEEEWWADEAEKADWEEAMQVKQIEAELTISLTPKERQALEKMSKVTGKQLTIIPVAKEKKPEKLGGCKPVVIKLLPTLRQTLDELSKQGISMSVISLNSPGSVKDIVEAFGLTDKFIEVRDTWKNKADVFEEITETHKINPAATIFVDNMTSHVQDVSKKCALGLVIGEGRDIEKPIQVMDFIEKAHG